MMKFGTLFHRPYDDFRCEPSPVQGVGGKDWNRRLGDEAGVNAHAVSLRKPLSRNLTIDQYCQR